MSFDLVVLAMAPNASPLEARAMLDHCTSGQHRDGDLDERIVAFYRELRTRYPDGPPLPPDSPWMSTPLAVGIDHLSMNITWSAHGTEAVEAILDLTQRHGLVLYDPQADEFTGHRWPSVTGGRTQANEV